MNKIKKIFNILIICFFINVLFSATVYADVASDYGVDFMETFDDLQDWVGQPVNGRDINKANMPQKIDDSDSMWDFYDYWSSTPSTEPTWIGDHGPNNVWGGTGKSLRMDLGQGSAAKKGPARFGLYFGTPNGGPPDAYSTSGSADSGYDEAYIFYMVKYPPNAFPKNDQEIYEGFGYYKFHVFASGFLSINVPISGGSTYGPGHNGHPNLKYCSSYCGPDALDSISIRHKYFLDGVENSYWTQNGSLNNFMANEEWFGVEFYYKRGTPGQSDGQMKIWLYDAQGNEKLVLDVTREMMPAGIDYKYNKFFFGGNLSFQDKVDAQGLDTTYYIDDFIINGSRIGPNYFVIKFGTPGDVNGDGEVDILDLQACVNVFLGTETRPDFIRRAKEVAEPKDECNVLDVQGIVNIILQ